MFVDLEPVRKAVSDLGVKLNGILKTTNEILKEKKENNRLLEILIEEMKKGKIENG